MANPRVDVDALYGALDAARRKNDMSWRELARTIGVSASTMSRLAQGQNPDVNAFATMVRWLRVSADTFIVEDGQADRQAVDPATGEPALLAQLAPLLRARKDLQKADVELLEALIESAVRRFSVDREAPGRRADPDEVPDGTAGHSSAG